MTNTPDLRALVERLERQAKQASEIAHQMADAKSMRQGDGGRVGLYAWPEPDQTLEGQAAAALTTLQHRVAEMEGLLSRAMDRMEYGQRWRCGQVGPTPDYAEIIAEIKARSTLKDRGEGR